MTRRLGGMFTATMELEGDSARQFIERVRDAVLLAPPRFDLIVCTRKRLAPVLVVRRRGARGRSHLRERFERTTTTLRNCELETWEQVRRVENVDLPPPLFVSGRLLGRTERGGS